MSEIFAICMCAA